jgi:hypothetical protein
MNRSAASIIGQCPGSLVRPPSSDDFEGDVPGGWDLRIRTARHDIMRWTGERHSLVGIAGSQFPPLSAALR